MKTYILLLVVLLALTAFPQILEGPHINELKGMEDKSGNTHLFYRIHYLINSFSYPANDEITDNVYHFDISGKKTTNFLPSYSFHKGSSEGFYITSDFKFWNNDPDKFIFCGIGGGIDGNGFIRRFDNNKEIFFPTFEPVNSIFISHKNDSLLLASTSFWIISKDGGRSWDTLHYPHERSAIIGIHPQKDSVIFFIRDNHLWKSNDLGFHSQCVDSSIKVLKYEPVFDSDNKHVYFIGIDNRDRYSLFVSDNEGEPGSLRQCFESYNNIMISVDKSKPGNIYVTDGFEIFFSDSYGLFFIKLKAFDKKIIGIYKKPDSDKLYLAQRYQLLVMENDSVSIIKKLPTPSHLLNLYPLAIGNKWVYDTFHEDYTRTKTPGINVREVMKDTVMGNGKRYYILREKKTGRYFSFNDTYERVDSTTGKIYSYDIYSSPGQEFVSEDLTAEGGETVLSHNYMTPMFSHGYMCKYFSGTLFGKLHYGLSLGQFVDGSGGLYYTLASGLGMTEYDCPRELAFRYYGKLRGAIINGILYGDTTLTDVQKINNNLPVDFSLFQNYPNPFNPATNIKYSLPHESKVLLTVYNTLGQKVKELVNEVKHPGLHEVKFDGSRLSSGIYFYRLQAGAYSKIKKLIIAK